MTDTRKQRQKGIRNADQALTVRGDHADRIVGSPCWSSSINYNRSMPEDLKLSQIGSSQLPPPFRGLHSPGVRKHCQIIFACYFRKSSIITETRERQADIDKRAERQRERTNTCTHTKAERESTDNTSKLLHRLEGDRQTGTKVQRDNEKEQIHAHCRDSQTARRTETQREKNRGHGGGGGGKKETMRRTERQ